MIRSFVSAIPLFASAALFTSMVPACSSNGAPIGFQDVTPHSGFDSGTGQGDDGNNNNTNADASSGPGLNLADGGQGDLGDAGCATASATATRQPVYMLFVLDGSGSMKQDNKWTAATAAIRNIFTDMKNNADQGLGAGLIVFSDTLDPTQSMGPYPSSADVPIAFVDANQLTKLSNRLGGQWSGDTPTGLAMGVPSGGGYGELTSFTPSTPLAPGGKKVLVLITDGVPNDLTCATNGDGSDNYQQNACVMGAASKWAAGQGIETFVVGVGIIPTTNFGNYDPYFLGALAQAGGSAPAGCDPKANAAGAKFCYFEVDPSGTSTATQQAFEAAINNIRGQVASCTFPLQAGNGQIDPSKVNVQINGATVPQDPTNGWTYDNPTNPTEVILHGTSCDQMKNTPNASVNIVLGCATKKPA